MRTQKTPSPFITTAFIIVISLSVVVTAVMTNAEGNTAGAVVSYARASANPYQQIIPYYPNVYAPTGNSVHVTSSRRTVLPKAALTRKINQLNRTIKSVHKRLMAAEDKIEILERTMTTVSGDTAGYQDSLTRLQKSRNQLSNQLAKLQSDLANVKLQLEDAK